MRKNFLLCAVVVVAISSLCVAADKPKAEIYGGYSYFRADLNESTTGVSPLNTNGWNAGVNVPFNRFLGVTADFSGQYKTESLASGTGTATGTLHEYNFLFGPALTFRSASRLTPFAHALFGESHLTASGSINSDLGSGSGSASDDSFAMAFGGGVDVKVAKAIAIRLGQFDWLRTQHYNLTQNNLRLSVGVVIKL